MFNQKIREAFEKAKVERMVTPEAEKSDLGFYLFKSGYMALLNELELGEWVRDSDNAPLYALPEGVEKP